MAHVPIILEDSVVSAYDTRVGVRRPKAHSQSARDLLCDLEQSIKPLWSQIPSLGSSEGPSQLFASLGISMLESEARASRMLLPDRGDLQTLFASCAWPTSCAEAKAKIFAETETREAPQETAADHEWNLTVQAGWAQPFTGRTKVERTSCLKSCSRSCGELGRARNPLQALGYLLCRKLPNCSH